MNPDTTEGPAAADQAEDFRRARGYADRAARLEHAGSDSTAMVRAAVSQLETRPEPAWMAQSEAFAAAGLFDAAAMVCNRALQRWPQQWHFAFGLGNALRLGGDITGAEAAFRDLLRVDPGNIEAGMMLAGLLRDVGRFVAACDIAAGLPLDLTDLAGIFRLGDFFTQCAARDRAALLYLKAAKLAQNAQHPELLHRRGVLSLIAGRFDEAESLLIRAFDQADSFAMRSTLAGVLAQLRRFGRLDEPLAQRLVALGQQAGDGDLPDTAVGFGLAKVFDDVGDLETASSWLRRANRSEKHRSPWSADRWADFVESQLESPCVSAWPQGAPGNIQPVYIVGLPRSGTTLVADRLGAHPDIRDRGELNLIPAIAEVLKNIGLDDIGRLQRTAIGCFALLRRDDPPVRYYIDQNPHNFAHLPTILSLSPNARILHCVRDRRDVALSLFRLQTGEGVLYTCDWTDIAAFAAGHDRLMRRYYDRFAGSILQVDYERFVAAPEQVLHEIQLFLGVTPLQLANSQSRDRDVATASAWQVRQSIHRGSIGRWRDYLPYFPELGTIGETGAA